MAIKGGAIITHANGVTLLDRVQDGGPGTVNIPTEKINELGNYKSVATVRDTPDLTFTYTSLDVTTETEAALTGQYAGRSLPAGAADLDGTTLTVAGADFGAADVGRRVILTDAAGEVTYDVIASVTSATVVELVTGGTAADATVRVGENGYDLSRALPMDIANQFKAGKDAPDPFKVVASVAVPFLQLESMSYRFGLRDNASQAGSLRGDSIFYNPGPAFVERVAGTGAADQAVVTSHPAYQSADGDHRRVLAVTVGSNRLVLGSDYTETYGAVANGAAITTLHLKDPVAADETIRIIYSSPDALSYPQSVHPDVSVKPAAVKGRDIDIYLGGFDENDPSSAQLTRVGGVQSISLDWRVTLEKDEEFGNYYAVAQDFDVPAVTGSLDFMPRDPADLLARLRQMANVSDVHQAIGTSTSQPLPLDIVVRDPETGKPIKRFHVPDARFVIPGYSGRVAAKTTVTITWESDEGDLLIFDQ
jgi:hypothetical protein